MRVHRNSDECYAILTACVTDPVVRPQPLFVSVGTADFVSGWLTRICRERVEPIKISELVIVRMRDELIGQMEKQGELEKGFRHQLKANLRVLRTDSQIRQKGIRVIEKLWEHRPPFHGYCYGSRVLIGHWSADSSGKLHVKTPLFDTTEALDPEHVAGIRRAFIELKAPAG